MSSKLMVKFSQVSETWLFSTIYPSLGVRLWNPDWVPYSLIFFKISTPSSPLFDFSPHTKEDFKKYNADRRALQKTMVVPAPLDPTTEEYRKLLQEAKDHRAHTLVAGDYKLSFIECLYDAGNGTIPQSV
ncbi:hypothetical protein B9Z55_028826 [Caenorhabditis nigoni]|uniref:Uncharacterized protein n=1 Tax=Caenorhabditis nigoni TaxID=1611254 RepID=A0A2G5S9V3_9PELO|nr:hypothetical protein B9Z55_028826 [Caenorhabditis nigoni]